MFPNPTVNQYLPLLLIPHSACYGFVAGLSEAILKLLWIVNFIQKKKNTIKLTTGMDNYFTMFTSIITLFITFYFPSSSHDNVPKAAEGHVS